MQTLNNLRLKHWSTYVGFALWGSSAFTSQPTIASFVVHFGIEPVLLALCIFLAHQEGKKSTQSKKTERYAAA